MIWGGLAVRQLPDPYALWKWATKQGLITLEELGEHKMIGPACNILIAKHPEILTNYRAAKRLGLMED